MIYLLFIYIYIWYEQLIAVFLITAEALKNSNQLLTIYLTQGIQDHGMQTSLFAPRSALSERHQFITRYLSIYFPCF